MKLHHLKLILFLGLLTVSLVNGEVVDDTEPDTEEEKQDDFDYGDDVSIADDDEESITKEIDDNEVNVEIHNYESPTPDPNKFYFAEHFDDKAEFNKKWIKSQARKDDIAEEIAKYDGEWNVEEPKKHIWKNDLGLVLKSKAKHAAIASKLSKPFMFDSKPLTVQYEVTMQDGQVCGGSYLKLLSCKGTEDLTKFNDKTPYTIMFGPDKCGNDIKLHFIFRHVNPINGSITEKHCRKPRERLEEPFKDKLPHLYQLLVKPDNTFEIRVDHRIVNQGSLLNDFEPPVNPPKEINDPNDKKPDDWDEREKIPDPTASKPDDWDEDAPPQIPDPNAVKPTDWLDDEEEMIPDPNAKKPDDWDTEMDGEWEPPLVENPVCENAVGCGKWKAPLVSNPDYKGKWRAPLIDNPNYQGKWLPKKIPNPDFFEDLHPFKMTPICAVGIEIWSMSNDIYFDNILITDDVNLADEWAEKTFDLKRKQIDKDAKTLWQRAMRYMGHKPHWWAVYFLYVSVPISLYIRFLRRTAKEEDTFVSKLIKLTNDNPYMWGVYILVVGVPLAFVIYSLCRSKKDEKNAAAAKAKKTDEPSPDDDQSINENSNINKNLIDTDNNDNDDDSKTENKEGETEKNVKEKASEDSINNLGINEKKSDDDDGVDDDGEPNNQNNTSPKSKKSDLEVENNENEINTSTTAIKTNKNEDFFESNVENIGGETEEISSHITEGARKRKPRKE